MIEVKVQTEIECNLDNSSICHKTEVLIHISILNKKINSIYLIGYNICL